MKIWTPTAVKVQEPAASPAVQRLLRDNSTGRGRSRAMQQVSALDSPLTQMHGIASSNPSAYGHSIELRRALWHDVLTAVSRSTAATIVSLSRGMCAVSLQGLWLSAAVSVHFVHRAVRTCTLLSCGLPDSGVAETCVCGAEPRW